MDRFIVNLAADVPKQLTAYLAGLPNVTDVAPVIVQIGRTRYTGARYTSADDTAPRLYLLGKLPASHGRAVYRASSDPRDHYVASWYDPSMPLSPWHDREYVESMHPFGAHFLVFRCDMPNVVSRGMRGGEKRIMRITIAEVS